MDEESRRQELRGAIKDAKIGEGHSSIFFAQVVLLSIGLGWGYKSWWVGLIVFLFFMIGMHVKYLDKAILFFFTAIWGLIAYQIGGLFDSTSAKIVCGIIGLLIGFGVNYSGMQWFKE